MPMLHRWLALQVVAACYAAEPFVVVDQVFVRPTGMDPAYAATDGDNDGLYEGSEQSLEFDYERTTAIRIGGRLADGDRIELAVWLADVSHEDTTRSSGTATVWDILYHPVDSGQDLLNTTAYAAGAVRGSTIDVAYVHVLDAVAAPWSAEISLGLRRADLRNELLAVYQTSVDEPWYVDHRSEASGLGLRAGARVRRGWWEDRIGVWAAIGYAVLQGRLETSDDHIWVDNAIHASVETSEQTGFTMLDAAVGVDATLGLGFAFEGGWQLSRWDGMCRFDRFVDAGDPSKRATSNESVTWDGFLVGLSWTYRAD
ncbi:MAG TPA: hypothetical protein VEL07_08090 [Planctomycetota bacterium]|nr:hypothetical protein [Planctomycetota bacterium]